MRARIISRETLLGFVGGLCAVAIVVSVMFYLRRGRTNEEYNDLIAFDPPSFNFGTIFQAETIRHEFKLFNNSTNEVRILGLRSSCRCTVVNEMRGKTIPPRGYLPVPVEFYSGSDRGIGGAKVEALVECGGRRDYAYAVIEGNVDADFKVEPTALNFGSLRPGEEATRAVTFWPRDYKSLFLKEPASMGNLNVLLHTNTSGNSTSYELRVTFKAPMVSSSRVSDYMIRVETSSTRVPGIEIPASVVVRPEIEITPQPIVLSKSSESGESRFTIHTASPSKINRVIFIKGQDSEVLPAKTVDEAREDTWDNEHVKVLSNALLTAVDRIDFELVIRNGTARNEARVVSVQIISL